MPGHSGFSGSFRGMARVVFFSGERNYCKRTQHHSRVYSISMYPKLWEASGIPYPQLIDELIQLIRKK